MRAVSTGNFAVDGAAALGQAWGAIGVGREARMIKYALRCGAGHSFDAWFRSSEACDEQIAQGAVGCPECGGADVAKAMMAPRIGRNARSAPLRTPEPAPGPDAASVASAPPPGRTRAPATAQEIETRLRALRAHVERTAEHVGDAFASEARRIHEGEAEARAIYGEADAQEARALIEDGVPVAPLPWIDRKQDH